MTWFPKMYKKPLDPCTRPTGTLNGFFQTVCGQRCLLILAQKPFATDIRIGETSPLRSVLSQMRAISIQHAVATSSSGNVAWSLNFLQARQLWFLLWSSATPTSPSNPVRLGTHSHSMQPVVYSNGLSMDFKRRGGITEIYQQRSSQQSRFTGKSIRIWACLYFLP